jgi:drug/metabolite transporter (DMT)-like permease
MTRRTERLGLLFAALCALNGAFVPAFAKLTTNAGDPVFIAMMTTLFAGVSAAFVLWLRGDLHVLVRGRVALRLLAVGALGTAVAFVLFFTGARRASAIDTVICLQTEPAYSLLMAWIFLGHGPTPRRVLSIGVLLAGILLAVGSRGIGTSAGIWLLLVTPLCWQASHVIVLRRLRGVAPEVLTGARYLDGALLLVVYWLIAGGSAHLPDVSELPRLLSLLAIQGFILCYVGTLLWYQAIARLDLARTTAIVVPSIPLLSLAASFLLLGEIPSPWQLTGLLLTAAGVLAFVTAADARAAAASAANGVTGLHTSEITA